MNNTILDFLRGFKKPEPIRPGDTCRNKTTGVYSTCLNVHGLYYGQTHEKQLDVGKIENFEKV